MIHQNALMLFASTPQIERDNPEDPLASITWEDLDALYTAFLGDVAKIAAQILDVDVFVYRNPNEISDDFFLPHRQRVHLYPLTDSPIPQQMHSAVEHAFQNKYQKVIVFLRNYPLVTKLLFRKIYNQLNYEDDCFVVGPESDGKCYLIGMKANHAALFELANGDSVFKSQGLLKYLCTRDSMLFPLEAIDSIDDPANLLALRRKIETMDRQASEYPARTSEIFKILDKKYKLKKHIK